MSSYSVEYIHTVSNADYYYLKIGYNIGAENTMLSCYFLVFSI